MGTDEEHQRREIAEAVREIAVRIEQGIYRAESFGVGIAEDEARMEMTLVVTYPILSQWTDSN